MRLSSSTESYQRAGVVPHRFGTPLFVVSTHRGISPACSTLRFSFDSPRRAGLRLHDYPLLRFHSSSGCDPHGPPDRLSAPAPSLGFVPIRRYQLRESTRPGLASPGTFPPRGFSPPRGFAPPNALRVCFTPLAPFGFFPPRDYPSQEAATASSAAPCPPDVLSRTPVGHDPTKTGASVARG
jgi:hypothetical protein